MVIRFLVLVAGFALSACGTSPQRSHDVALTTAMSGDLEAAMRGCGSVALHPRACLVRPRPGGFAQLARQATDRAIARVFGDAGYGFAGPGQADCLIAYAIGATGSMDDAEIVRIFGISSGVGQAAEAPRGGLVMAIIDRRTGIVRWRGGTSQPIAAEPFRDASELDAEVLTAMRRLLDGLPMR